MSVPGSTPDTIAATVDTAADAAAKAAADAAAKAAEVGTQALDVGEVAKNGIGEWIYDSMGGDEVFLAYVEKNSDELESAMNLFGVQKAQIETREGLATLHITHRIGLLIWAQLKGAGDDDEETPETADIPAAVLSLKNVLKEKGKTLSFTNYRAYWEANPGATAPLFPDPSHGILKGVDFDWLKISTALETKEKDVLKKWPEHFPFPAGSRVVMDKSPEDAQIFADNTVGKDILEFMGLKMTVVPVGSALTAPAENEIQLVSLQDAEPMDWEKVKEAAKLWDDSVPTQYSGAPKTLAAIQVLKDSKSGAPRKPEDLCAAVGTTPDPALLEFLKTVPA